MGTTLLSSVAELSNQLRDKHNAVPLTKTIRARADRLIGVVTAFGQDAGRLVKRRG